MFAIKNHIHIFLRAKRKNILIIGFSIKLSESIDQKHSNYNIRGFYHKLMPKKAKI